ncbi:hypothetical protein GCM10009087_50740 [Sphingomonas oligophenolica]|uniref:Acetyl-CoA hydrolase/transferase C-terminal domain-containing protein n=1 Tax=Sphingomonas oligophenolica TaxID=301154 RepID=A0ABU9Y6J0_9SPHN
MRAVLDLFRPGIRLYLPGGSGEILALADALAADPQRLQGTDLTSCLLPGFNGFDYAALAPETRLTTFMLPPAFQGSAASGNTRVVPLPYSGIARFLEESRFDIALFHVAEPDENGLCSLGISADFAPHVWRTARHRVLVVNPDMPRFRRGPSLALADADLVCDWASPLVSGKEDRPTPVTETIAATVAALIPDSATLQFGIGGAPGATWRHLTAHRDLRIASGMVTAGIEPLQAAGALRADDSHVAGIAIGDAAFYERLANRDDLQLAPVGTTHNAAALGCTERFCAINSALEVDLFGQANLEWRDGRQISGIGGALDFAQAAMASHGGRGITALAATAREGSVSRIVPRLASATVSLSRDHVDTVVTEYGAATLPGMSVEERAQALIAIAAPAHRDDLQAEWRRLRSHA